MLSQSRSTEAGNPPNASWQSLLISNIQFRGEALSNVVTFLNKTIIVSDSRPFARLDVTQPELVIQKSPEDKALTTQMDNLIKQYTTSVVAGRTSIEDRVFLETPSMPLGALVRALARCSGTYLEEGQEGVVFYRYKRISPLECRCYVISAEQATFLKETFRVEPGVKGAPRLHALFMSHSHEPLESNHSLMLAEGTNLILRIDTPTGHADFDALLSRIFDQSGGAPRQPPNDLKR